jgi:hypothetical protein
MCIGTRGYNISVDTTNRANHGEIQPRNNIVHIEFNSKHTSRSAIEEGERGYFSCREYSAGS